MVYTFGTMLFLFDFYCTHDKHKFDAHDTFNLMVASAQYVFASGKIYMELRACYLNQKEKILCAKGVISHLLVNDWLTLSETHCITNKQTNKIKKR